MRSSALRPHLFVDLILVVLLGVSLSAMLPARSQRKGVAEAAPGGLQAPDPPEPERPQSLPPGALRIGPHSTFNGTKLAGPEDPVQVIVELLDEPAAAVFAREHSRAAAYNGRALPQTVAAARAQIARIAQSQQRMVSELSGARFKARVISQVDRVFNGMTVSVASGRLDAIRALPGVKAVHTVNHYHRMLDGSAPFIGSAQVWSQGNTGQGVVVVVIESGIDYTHVNFGESGTYPNNKIIGGFDFAGDDFDGTNSPEPDPDPISNIDHGTKVASAIAGYGVNADGTTYTGPYNQSTPFSSLRIGPGVAPGASLIVYKVFGPTGSTTDSLIIQAIDAAADPNGDGDMSDHADIINMSLGAPFGHFDGSAVITSINNAALIGIVNTVAAGNSGDTYYDTNSLGNTAAAISVAAMVDDARFYQNVQVISPSSLAGNYPAGVATFGPIINAPVTGDLILASPGNACTPLTNGAAVNGKIVFVESGGCGYGIKVNHSREAGASAVIVSNNSLPLPVSFGGGLPGTNPDIPAFLLSQTGFSQIQSELTAGVQVNALIDPDNIDPLPELANTKLETSPRGGAFGNVVKPDISAPGAQINSAYVGSTNGLASISGTSMSAPHVAGVLALLKQTYPDAGNDEYYRRLTSTAVDVFQNPNNALPVYGVTDTGAGTVQAIDAAATDIFLAYTTVISQTHLYGEVREATVNEEVNLNIQITNADSAAQNFAVTYNGVSDIPGVDASFPSSVNVPGNSTVDFRLNWNFVPASMRHTRDAAVDATHSGQARHWLSEEIGYINFTPSGGGKKIRLPTYFSARPASNMTTAQTSLNLSASSGSANLALTGQQVFTGNDFANGDMISLLYPFEWQGFDANEPSIPDGLDYSDIQHVGVRTSSSGSDQVLQIGIATYGDWRTPNDVMFNVFIDVNRDGEDDFRLFSTSFPNAQGAPGDAFVARLMNLDAGTTSTQLLINLFSPVTRPTFPFNTNFVVLGALTSALGLSGGNSVIDYTVVTSIGSTVVDKSAQFRFDIANPGLNFSATSAFNDLNGSTVPVTYNLENFRNNGSEGALLLHTLNTSGNHAQVLPANLGLEGDVSPRRFGDGAVDATDFSNFGEFVVRLEELNNGNEHQRGDAAPRNEKGNGRTSVSDWVLIGLFSDGLVSPVQAGGPLEPVTPSSPQSAPQRQTVNRTSGSSQARTLRAVSAGFTAGQTGTLDIEIDALGGENGFGFSLEFDPAVLSFVAFEPGAAVPGQSLQAVNPLQTATGRLGLALVLPPGQGLEAGTRRIARVNFNVLDVASAPTTQITFGDTPALREVASVNADEVPTSYTGAQVSIIRTAAHVSAASFSGASLAGESIIAAFGTALATATEVATQLPLPTNLAGTTVSIRDSAGADHLALLFFVSAGQINYALPVGVALGPATITITSGSGAVSTGEVTIEAVAPGLFAANATGQGVAAAQVLRVKANGEQVFEQTAVFDAGTGRFVIAPIDLGPPEEQVFLVLFGTGVRFRSNLAAVQLTVGGTNLEALYAGPQGGFVGLDQINALLSRTLLGRGTVEIQLIVDGKAANILEIGIR